MDKQQPDTTPPSPPSSAGSPASSVHEANSPPPSAAPDSASAAPRLADRFKHFAGAEGTPALGPGKGEKTPSPAVEVKEKKTRRGGPTGVRNCDSCRTKKQKCDRMQPCGSCALRRIDCTYEEAGPIVPSQIEKNHIEAARLRREVNTLVKVLGLSPDEVARLTKIADEKAKEEESNLRRRKRPVEEGSLRNGRLAPPPPSKVSRYEDDVSVKVVRQEARDRPAPPPRHPSPPPPRRPSPPPSSRPPSYPLPPSEHSTRVPSYLAPHPLWTDPYALYPSPSPYSDVPPLPPSAASLTSALLESYRSYPPLSSAYSVSPYSNPYLAGLLPPPHLPSHPPPPSRLTVPPLSRLNIPLPSSRPPTFPPPPSYSPPTAPRPYCPSSSHPYPSVRTPLSSSTSSFSSSANAPSSFSSSRDYHSVKPDQHQYQHQRDSDAGQREDRRARRSLPDLLEAARSASEELRAERS